MTDFTRVTDNVDDVLATQYNALIDGLQQLPGPEGFLINGKISVTVASNNLTLAVKTLAGTDPTATDPVAVRIGDTVRTITSALSVTVAAGANSFNSGGAELATQEIDYFAYLGWRTASSAVVLGFGRIPYATLYSDFSGTATAETYGAFSTAPASTDSVVLIGRFAATLSAGAGYTWTVPTFTEKNLIQRPIYETRELIFVPAFANLSVGDGTLTARYKLILDRCKLHFEFIFGASSSISGNVVHTLPFSKGSSYASLVNPTAPARLADATALPAYAGLATINASQQVNIVAQDASGTYLKQVFMSSTIPFTWTTSDAIQYQIEYFI